MWMKVYRLRDAGQRLPGAEVERRGPVEGELLYTRKVMQRRSWCAALVRRETDKDYDLIPPMDPAVMVDMTAKGLLITGQEFICTGVRKHETHIFRQSWWCVPATRVRLAPGRNQPPPLVEMPTDDLGDEWPLRA